MILSQAKNYGGVVVRHNVPVHRPYTMMAWYMWEADFVALSWVLFAPIATRVPGLSRIYASPVAAGGYVFLTGRSGRTVVLKDGEKFEVVASNSVGETVDATPAPVGKQLFIRGEKHLFCIEE